MTQTSIQPAVTIQTLGDSWVKTSWDNYCQLLEQPTHDKTWGYYFKGHMRLEMPPVSYDHSKNDYVMSLAVGLWGITQRVTLEVLPNCTYRKTGVASCQPDISVYVGELNQAIPSGTGIIDLNQFPAPNLVIEIAKSSLLDDLGIKRALYESLGVAEYWVVDVQNLEITVYKIADQGSWAIRTSNVLPGLSVGVLEEALRRNQETQSSEVGAWLLNQFQTSCDSGPP
ncbi:Uma2 family endonuclease [Synechococcus sp. PCC 6312]|uniref:Uma2 family endonuclease n=1 Tax=Synechococcus sp. (strain ATCC 27167 / PCC 6312) TaxID=195253 RepID=UPI00029F133B|nr:Uma2 family endonuclease [Synechococcus sp. PCC 6312]AFY59559.1 hypothetical protein Syn6312_0325 [Synechococcus sp. PCC 6312]